LLGLFAGGPAKDEKDSDLYSIHLMDKPGHELILDVPYKVRLFASLSRRRVVSRSFPFVVVFGRMAPST
jgi:hypothetical protein